MEKDKITNQEMTEEMVVLDDQEIKEMRAYSRIDWNASIKYLELQKEAFLKFRKIALAITKPSDWVIIDKKAFLQEHGANQIANMLGINFGLPHYEKEFCEDSKGKYYIWTCTQKANCTKTGREVGATGICSSRDKFFGVVNGEFKPLDEIDERNIKAKAGTNCRNNAVKMLTALKNVELSELVDVGIDIKQIVTVDHKSKGAVSEASKKAVEEASKKGAAAEEYSLAQVELSQKLTERIFQANSLDELKRVWEEDKAKRTSLPKKLFEQIVIEKDKKKEWLQKQKDELPF